MVKKHLLNSIAIIFTLQLAACGGGGSSEDSAVEDGDSIAPPVSPEQEMPGIPFQELYDQGVDKYLGMTYPSESDFLGQSGTVHSFTGQEGPLCFTGNQFTMSTRDGTTDELMIFLEGGGGCGPNNCEAIDRTLPGVPRRGIMDPSDSDNPAANYNVGYVPYCDGTLFTGDVDIDTDEDGLNDRFFRGLKNLSAALNVIQAAYPAPSKILLAGNSAGGLSTHFALPLVRKLYPLVPIDLVNDSGLGIYEPGDYELLTEYWNSSNSIPLSCATCIGEDGNLTDYHKYQLAEDDNLRMGFMSSKQDAVITQDFSVISAPEFEEQLLQAVSEISEAHPQRFRSLIANGDSHTFLQRQFTVPVGGTTVQQWIADMLSDSENWDSVIE